MDFNIILKHLIESAQSFPAIKLVWDCGLSTNNFGESPPRVTPSHYKKEIQYTTEERYALLCRQQTKINFWKSNCDVVPIPSLLVFQNYTPGEKYNITLSLRNISKQSQKATFLMEESDLFSFDNSTDRIVKFAPGMSVSAKVNFEPDDDKDYYHKIIVSTKNFRFAIPIVGIGSRGLLELPDVIEFGKVPVNFLKTQSITVWNTGTKTARFTLSTDGSFSVRPERGVVCTQESFNLHISFISDKAQKLNGHLILKYENGEEVSCCLQGETVVEDIRIIPASIFCDNTYMGMKSKMNAIIVNNSDITVDFKWKKYRKATMEIINSSSKMPNINVLESNMESKQESLLNINSSVDPSLRDLVNSKTFVSSEMENFFGDENFLIEPLVGQISPHSQMDVLIVFSPLHPSNYTAEAFVDITGLEKRLSLKMHGKGLGPTFNFGFEHLDVGTVFLGGGHSYEIPVVNTSEIEGDIFFSGIIPSLNGLHVKVEPAHLRMAPGEYKAFYMNFHAGGKPSSFQEDLKFTVPKTGQIFFISVKGVKSFPRMHFSVKEVALGDVSYGFPKSQQILLINDSLNEVEVSVKVDSDGTDPPLDYTKILESFKYENFVFDKNPREFTVEPIKFTLSPRGFQRLTITVCANQCRTIERNLLAFICDDTGELGELTHTLPIVGKCKVPSLISLNPDLHLKDIYIHFPYPTEFVIQNSTDLQACYCIVPTISTKIRTTSDNFVGICNARDVTTIPFNVICLQTGESSASYDFYAVGKEQKLLTLTLKCTATPSKLQVNPKLLDFGQIGVLHPCNMTVDIINDSPLSVPFTTIIVDGGAKGDHWELDPTCGDIQPHSTMTILVTVTLQESIMHSAILRVQMREATAFIDVKLKAAGSGTSFKFVPFLNKAAEINFGPMFTKTDKSYNFEVTNLGHLPKMLDWRNEKELAPTNLEGTDAVVETKLHSVKRKKIVERKRRAFSITPATKLLPPMTTVTVSFTAHSNVPKFVVEDFILWTYLPKENKANNSKTKRTSSVEFDAPDQKLLQQLYKPTPTRYLKLSASFECPQLTFSRKSLLFKIESSPMQRTFERRESIKVKNVGLLPLLGTFETQFPFNIIVKNEDTECSEWSHDFEPGEEIIIIINFDGRHLRKDRGTVVFQENLEVTYDGHEEREIVELRGEVHFPTINIERTTIDFGVIVNGTESVDELTITNPCSFCLTYKWYIKPKSTVLHHKQSDENYVRQSENKYFISSDNNIDKSTNTATRNESELSPVAHQLSLKTNITPSSIVQQISDGTQTSYPSSSSERKFNRTSESKTRLGNTLLMSSLSQQCISIGSSIADETIPVSKDTSYSSIFKKDVPEDRLPGSDSRQCLDTCGEFVQFLRGMLFRRKIMNIVGIRDPAKEMEDELNYLNYYHDDKNVTASEAVSINEIVDIVPLAGILQAGQTQRFTIVFYGYPNIDFTTAAICFIEGGTSKTITIKGQSTSPPVRPIPIFPSLTEKVDDKDETTQTPDCLSSIKAKQNDLISKDQSLLDPEAENQLGLEMKEMRHTGTDDDGDMDETIHLAAEQPSTPNVLNSPSASALPVPKISAAEDLQPFIVPNICIEPEVIFSSVIPILGEDEIVDRVFIEEDECFDFGPTLVPLKKYSSDSKDSLKKTNGPNVVKERLKHKENSSRFIARNISTVPATVNLGLVHERYDSFEFEPRYFTIKPGEEQIIEAWAFPCVPDLVNEDNLVWCIHDNPDPFYVKVRVFGTLPKISLDEDMLDFGRCVLNHLSVAHITISNTGLIPVTWQLSKSFEIPSAIIPAKTHGTLKPRETSELRFLFKATRPVILNGTPIAIEVRDTQNILGVVDIFKILIYAEGYDVLVDIVPEKEDATLLNFGLLPVGLPTTQNILIINRGNYDIRYTLSLEMESLSKKQQKNFNYINNYFLINPKEALVHPNEARVVQIVLEPPVQLDFQDENLIKCQIVDLNMNVIVAEIPIPVSLKSRYAGFTIFPEASDGLNLNFIPVGETTSKTFSITNTGHFAFQFFIHRGVTTSEDLWPDSDPEEIKEEDEDDEKSGSRSQSSTAIKKEKNSSFIAGKKIKLIVPTASEMQQRNSRRKSSLLENKQNSPQAPDDGMENFNVFPLSATIETGHSLAITVECTVPRTKRYMEDLRLEIPYLPNALVPKFISYTIQAMGSFPKLNFEERKSIFSEHHIARDLSDSERAPSDLPHVGIYIEDYNCFVFQNVPLWTTSTARFKLVNPRSISAQVSIRFDVINGIDIYPEVTETTKEKKIEDNIFKLHPSSINVVPYGTAFFHVEFSPHNMTPQSATLTAELKGVPDWADVERLLSFDIRGEGGLPVVTISAPTTQDEEGRTIIIFDHTHIGQTRVLPFQLTSKNLLPCQVMFEILKPSGVFEITSSLESSRYIVEGASPGSPFNLATMMPPASNLPLEVLFKPRDVNVFREEVLIYIDGNPFDILTMVLQGMSNDDYVYLEGIPSFLPPDIPGIAPTTQPPIPIGKGKKAKQKAEKEYQLALSQVQRLKGVTANPNRPHHILLNDCSLNKPYKVAFRVVNATTNNTTIRFQWNPPDNITISPNVGHILPGVSKNVTLTYMTAQPCNFINEPISCKVIQIKYPSGKLPTEWDDRVQRTNWTSDSNVADKNKFDWAAHETDEMMIQSRIIESEPEPSYEVIPNSQMDVVVLISAHSDIPKLEISDSDIILKNTYIFQTMTCEVRIKNTGTVQLEYSWNIDVLVQSQSEIDMSNESLAIASDIDPQFKALQGYNPFTIIPAYGTIAAGSYKTFAIRFRPCEIKSYQAIFYPSVTDCNQNPETLKITVIGHGVLPYCHMDIEESTYLSSGRSWTESSADPLVPLRGPTLDQNMKVLEIVSIGLGHTVRRSFKLLNPTSAPYKFVWVYEDDGTPPSNWIECETVEGVVLPGRLTEMVFEFTPYGIGIAESLWSFNILQLEVDMKILIVGKTIEPIVYFQPPAICFKPVLVDNISTEKLTLHNKECIPLKYEFQNCPINFESDIEQLTVEPKKGIIPTQGVVSVNLNYKCTEARKADFEILCKIGRKSYPIVLNIKAESYKVECNATLEYPEKQIVTLVPNAMKDISFGKLLTGEPVDFKVVIQNTGGIGFDYKWEPDKKFDLKKIPLQITYTSEGGVVASGETVEMTITYKLTKKIKLPKFDLTLKIWAGPVYTLRLRAMSDVPNLFQQYEEYDFGMCFLWRNPMIPYRACLLLANKESVRNLKIDCLYQSKPHLSVDFSSLSLSPGEGMEVWFDFKPTENRKYKEVIPLLINGIAKKQVTFMGEGIPLRVGLVNPLQKELSLGPVNAGTTATQIVHVKNSGRLPVRADFFVLDTAENVTRENMNNLYGDFLKLTPASCLIKPNQVVAVTLSFSPRTRIPDMRKRLIMEIFGKDIALSTIKAVCVDREFRLDKIALQFGSVLLHSSLELNLNIINSGDYGARFHWNEKKFQPDFSIQPTQGYCSPKSTTSITVKFKPESINPTVVYRDLKCELQGVTEPLTLALLGSCAPPMPAKEIYKFSTPVRTSVSIPIPVINRSSKVQLLTPMIAGEYFSGEVTHTIPPRSVAEYMITYHPLKMTDDVGKHTGTVFFPLPDGSGELYNILGSSTTPEVEELIERTVKSKSPYTENVPIRNWLSETQLFKVTTDALPSLTKLGNKDSKTNLEEVVFLVGQDHIEVPPYGTREYLLHFVAYKEGSYDYRVTFTSESGEYIFFDLTFKVVKPDVILTIQLNTAVRRNVFYELTIENPLHIDAILKVNCSVPYVIVSPKNSVVKPETEITIKIECFALLPGQYSGPIEIISPELGSYPYLFFVDVKPSPPEKPLYFSTDLGKSFSLLAKFQNYLSRKTEFKIQINNDEDFTSDEKSVIVEANDEGQITLVYEPSFIGQVHGIVTISSKLAGAYSFPLYGICVHPKPTGPFLIHENESVTLKFQNPFLKLTAFKTQIDCPSFNVNIKRDMSLNSKQEIEMAVQLLRPPTVPTVVTNIADLPPLGLTGKWEDFLVGKLVILCCNVRGAGPDGMDGTVSWIYYLQGVIPNLRKSQGAPNLAGPSKATKGSAPGKLSGAQYLQLIGNTGEAVKTPLPFHPLSKNYTEEEDYNDQDEYPVEE